LAAKRSGIFTVIIPAANAKDLKEIDAETKRGLKVLKVAHVRDILRLLFPKPKVGVRPKLLPKPLKKSAAIGKALH
jgi:ATP-dependent Lon protease